MADVNGSLAVAVWRFAAPQTAEETLPRLEALTRGGAADIDAAAMVWWPLAQRKPSIRDLGGLTHPAALWGGFWGVVLALIFLTPLAGPTFGAAAGAFAGSLADFGVEDDFVRRVRDQVTPGTSAVFAIGGCASVDAIAATLEHGGVELISSTLSLEQARHLRDALGEESAHRVP
jgi:uncharacterized membrane protein